MEEQANALVEAVDRHLAGWLVACVRRHTSSPDVLATAAVAAERAQVEAVAALRELVAADVDEQRTTPLAILRGAVRHATAVLRDAGVPPVERDAFSRERFPDDDYGLAPAAFADVHPEVGDAGIAWGAAKAMAHRRRHEGSGAP